MNSQKGVGKQSHLEEMVNWLIKVIFIAQLVFCFLMGALSSAWNAVYADTTTVYLGTPKNSPLTGIISFFSFLLLLNTMIPISLIVTIEIVKYFQGYFMNNDIKMFSNAKEKFVKVNSCSLNEELGQIKYVFSDKTGTLTSNKLEFKAAAIGSEIYGISDENLEGVDMKKIQRKVTHKSGGIGLNYLFSFPSETIKIYTSKRQLGRAYENVFIPSSSGEVMLKIENQKEIVEQYLLNLAVNQTCFVEITKKKTNKLIDDDPNITNRNLLKNGNNNINNEDQTMLNNGKVESNLKSIDDISNIQYKVNLLVKLGRKP